MSNPSDTPDVVWGTRRPGDNAMIPDSEPNLVVMGKTSKGDWVKLPPELGGQSVQVQDAKIFTCPTCKRDHRGLTLPDNIVVIEATCQNQFIWARITPKAQP